MFLTDEQWAMIEPHLRIERASVSIGTADCTDCTDGETWTTWRLMAGIGLRGERGRLLNLVCGRMGDHGLHGCGDRDHRLHGVRGWGDGDPQVAQMEWFEPQIARIAQNWKRSPRGAWCAGIGLRGERAFPDS